MKADSKDTAEEDEPYQHIPLVDKILMGPIDKYVKYSKTISFRPISMETSHSRHFDYSRHFANLHCDW